MHSAEPTESIRTHLIILGIRIDEFIVRSVCQTAKIKMSVP